MNADKIKEHLLKGAHITVLNNNEIEQNLTFNESFRVGSFAVILMRKGRMVFESNFVSNSLVENEVYLVSAGSLFVLREISDDAQYICLGFNKAYLKEQGVFLKGAEIVHLLSAGFIHKFSLSKDESDDLMFVLTSLKKKLMLPFNTPHLNDIIRHSFLAVFYEILIVYNKRSIFNSVMLNSQEILTTNFLSLLGDEFRQQKKVQYYAKQLCVTPRYLSSVVKQVVGKTAGEVIDEIVINEAKVLLSSGILNVAQVANELNFSDQSFFGKFFKKYTGVSPTAYKLSAVNTGKLF